MTPRLLALDIDGTLVDWEERISPVVLQHVRAAAAAGIEVVLATGRSVHGVTPLLDRIGLPEGHIVASNGSVTSTYWPVQVTAKVTFDARDAVHAVLQHLPEALVAVEVVGGGFRVNRAFPDGEISGDIRIEPVDELVSQPVTRVIIRDPLSSAEDFAAMADSLGLRGTNYSVGYSAWLDLAPEGVSKASALAEVAATLGVSAADALAIGDGRNDVEMLRWAGRGVAMGQAPQEVRAAADAVTGSYDEDGVAAELSRWLPKVADNPPIAAK